MTTATRALHDFIVDRLTPKGFNMELESLDETTDYMYRFNFRQKDPKILHVITLLCDNEKAIKRWYNEWMFDQSMTKEEKAKLRIDHPIDEEVVQRFSQNLTIDGINYYVRWTTYDKLPTE